MASRPSKTIMQQWAALWEQFFRAGTVIHAPLDTRPSFYTAAAEDLGSYRPNLPSPPSIVVSDNIDAMILPYTGMMSASRVSRMRSRFNALLREWFYEYSVLYCPEDSGHLLSSYNQKFREGIEGGRIVIASDLDYAGIVEQMTIQNPTKPTTKSHFAAEASAEVRRLIPQFLQEAERFART